VPGGAPALNPRGRKQSEERLKGGSTGFGKTSGGPEESVTLKNWERLASVATVKKEWGKCARERLGGSLKKIYRSDGSCVKKEVNVPVAKKRKLGGNNQTRGGGKRSLDL